MTQNAYISLNAKKGFEKCTPYPLDSNKIDDVTLAIGEIYANNSDNENGTDDEIDARSVTETVGVQENGNNSSLSSQKPKAKPSLEETLKKLSCAMTSAIKAHFNVSNSQSKKKSEGKITGSGC